MAAGAAVAGVVDPVAVVTVAMQMIAAEAAVVGVVGLVVDAMVALSAVCC